MGPAQRLSPMTAYYLRKLIETNINQLAWKSPEYQGEISLDVILRPSYGGLAVAGAVLDQLVMLHQSLTKTYPADSPQVQDVETQIFEGLGLKIAPSTASDEGASIWGIDLHPTAHGSKITGRDLVHHFNAVREKGDHFLGPVITCRYLLETRPSDPWCHTFKFSEKEPISFGGTALAVIKDQHLLVYLQWVRNFAEKCSLVLTDFEGGATGQVHEALFSGTFLEK